MKLTRRLLANIILLTIIGIGLSGCGKRGDAGGNKANDSRGKSQAQHDSGKIEPDTSSIDLERIPVEVATVQKGDISNFLLLSATVETEAVADVYPLVSGIIESIFVEEGACVQEGQPLLHLEDDEIILNEQQAEVEYQQQKATFARLQKMHDQALVSDEEFENARFNLQQAAIARDKARLTRQRTTIRSPIDGVVTERLVQTGNLVTTSTKLFVVTNPEEKICRVWVPERDLKKLAVGQKAYVTSKIALQRKFPGWIKRISPVVDPATGTCKVTIGIKDLQNELRPGMFVSIEIVIDTHKDAVLASKSALLYENDRAWVFVVEDTLAVKRRVEIGYADGSRFEALRGLSWGDTVVVVGQTALKDSTRVRIVNLDSTLVSATTGAG